MHEREAIERFDCFGSSCAVLVRGAHAHTSAEEAAQLAKHALLSWHSRFSRFSAGSELWRLNADPRASVPVSPLMARLASVVSLAASSTGGLVDATMVDAIEAAGYAGEPREPLELDRALSGAPPRRPARPDVRRRWRALDVDPERNVLTRPPGVKIDSGGLAKGMFADLLAAQLAGHLSFALDCGGDLRIGGSGGLPRTIEVESPFDGGILHTFSSASTGVATSGIGRRLWRDAFGAPAHHLLDPSTGRPAYTGVVQATALAPSAVLAEVYAKAAVLSGPEGAARWLRHGGVVVLEDGSHEVVEPEGARRSRTAPGSRPQSAQGRAA